MAKVSRIDLGTSGPRGKMALQPAYNPFLEIVRFSAVRPGQVKTLKHLSRRHSWIGWYLEIECNPDLLCGTSNWVTGHLARLSYGSYNQCKSMDDKPGAKKVPVHRGSFIVAFVAHSLVYN